MLSAVRIRARPAERHFDFMETVRKVIVLYIGLLALAAIAVGMTTLMPVEVRTHSDMNALTCGWPFPFVESDQSWRDPPLPTKLTCFGGEWGDPVRVYWLQFFVDVGVFYVAFALLTMIKGYVIRGRQNDHGRIR